MLRAKDIMTSDVITVNPDTPVIAAIQQLIAHQISGMPVVTKDKKIYGIFTEDDAVMICQDPDRNTLLTQTLRECRLMGANLVNTQVVSVGEETRFEEIAQILFTRKIKRVPVVRGMTLVGIVSRRDILKGTLREFAATEPRDGEKS